MVGGTADHVHTITAIPPTIAVSKFLRDLKSQTTGKIKRRLDIDFAWQIGFGGFTLNPDDMDGICDYVRNQKLHHSEGTTRSAYERIAQDEPDSESED